MKIRLRGGDLTAIMTAKMTLTIHPRDVCAGLGAHHGRASRRKGHLEKDFRAHGAGYVRARCNVGNRLRVSAIAFFIIGGVRRLKTVDYDCLKE